MMRGRTLSCFVALAGLALAPAAAKKPVPPPGPDWDFVSFEVKSWGAPITSWRIGPNGGGSWTEAVNEEGQSPRAQPSLAWHEIAENPANYIALEEILRRLPDPAPNSSGCKNFMTDAPYGILRMTKGATTIEIAWNDGCRDPDYREFIDILREADQHIAGLGKAAPITRSEPASPQ